MPKLQLSFHGTFALKKEDLRKILQTAAEGKALNDDLEHLMTRTGLGNRKVGPMITWAVRAGLVKDKSLSAQGKMVLRTDPNLESIVTDWLMHFYLSFGSYGLKTPPGNPADWGGWSYFIYSFLPQHRNFTLDELVHNCTLIFDQERPQNITKNLRMVLRAYTETQALGACKFITQEKDIYQSGNARLPNPYLMGYFLAQLWERDFAQQGSILTESILKQKMGLAPILGINTEVMEEQLNVLEAYGIIEQRRAVPPFQIVPRWDNTMNLLEKAYDADS